MGRVRTLIWCKECAGSASENRLRRRLRGRLQAQRIEVVLSAHKVGAGLSAGEKNEKMARQRRLVCKGKRARRSPRVNFSVSVVCTMKAPLWLNVDIQNGGPDLSDKISEAKMLHKEYKRACALREREFLNLSFYRCLSCLVCGFCLMF